jgi:hypothetical protein
MKLPNIQRLVLIAAACFLTSHGATAQVLQFAEILRAHGVDTSEPSLLAALNNSEPR